MSAWQWPGYPNYYDTGAGATFITLSNLTWVSSTVTTFNVSVASDAPTGPIFLALRSTFGWDFWGVSIQPPAPPAPPAPPPHVCQTPAFAPSSPVTPDTWIPGKTYQVTVKGTGFTTSADATETCPGTQITISVDTGSVDLSNVVVVDSTTISAKVTPAETDPGEMAEVQLWGPQNGGDDVVRANAAQTAAPAPMTSSNSSIPGMNLIAQKPASITPVVVQAQNVTPSLNLPSEKTSAGVSGAKTAHLTLGGTFQIWLGSQQANGTIQTIPSTFSLGAPTLSGNLDPNALFPGNAVFKYTSPGQGNGAAVYQAVHLGTQQLTITPKDTKIPPINITLSVEDPSQLGPPIVDPKLNREFHGGFEAALYPVADQIGIPPQMIKGQVRQEGKFNPMAWRYEPFGGGSGDLRISNKPDDLRMQVPYSSLRLRTIGDGVDPGNCGTHATMGNVQVIVSGVPSAGSSLSPASAAPGDQVIISGSNFGASQTAVSGSVTVNGVNAVIIDWSNASITAVVPPYNYIKHVDSRKVDLACPGLGDGVTFSQRALDTGIPQVAPPIVIPNRDQVTGLLTTGTSKLSSSDRYISIRDLVNFNPKQRWNQNATGREVALVTMGPVDFSAQLSLAASYGLLQTTYYIAVSNKPGGGSWTGSIPGCGPANSMDPSNLFDTACNLSHKGGTLGVGTRITARYFINENSAVPPSIADEPTLELLFSVAYQHYDPHITGYGHLVIGFAGQFEPSPAGTIFKGGQ